MNYYVEKQGANHALHLVLTLLTCGLWAVTGWPIAAIMGRKRTYMGPNYGYMPPQQLPPRPVQHQVPHPPSYPPGSYYGQQQPNPYKQPPGPYGTPPPK